MTLELRRFVLGFALLALPTLTGFLCSGRQSKFGSRASTQGTTRSQTTTRAEGRAQALAQPPSPLKIATFALG